MAVHGTEYSLASREPGSLSGEGRKRPQILSNGSDIVEAAGVNKRKCLPVVTPSATVEAI